MSYMFSGKRVVKVTSVWLMSSLLQEDCIGAKGCSADENERVKVPIIINSSDNGSKNKRLVNGHRSNTKGESDVIVSEVIGLSNEKNTKNDNDINEKSYNELNINHDFDDIDDLNFAEMTNENDLNIEKKITSDDIFANLRVLIDDLKKGKEDYTEALKLIHEEECKLINDKVNPEVVFEFNKDLFSFFLNSIIRSISSLFGVDVSDNIFRPMSLSNYNMCLSSLTDIDIANLEFLRLNSYIIILNKFIDDNKSSNELSIKSIAKKLHSVLKDVKNAQSTLIYAVYSGIASVLMNFVVHLQDKLIFLFPSLYNGSDKSEITIRLDVKADFIKNIGNALADHKLIERMLCSNCALLKLLHSSTVNIASPIFSVSNNNFMVKSEGLGYLSLLSGCNDFRCDFVDFLNKYIFSMKVNTFESETYKKPAESLRQLISNCNYAIDNVLLENNTSKQNCKLASIKFI